MKTYSAWLCLFLLTSCVPADQYASLAASATQKAHDFDRAQSSANDASQELTRIRNLVGQVNLENDRLRALISSQPPSMCNDQLPGMKYTNSGDATKILAAWVAQRSDVLRVEQSYRSSLWSNADTKIHLVEWISKADRQKYTYQFIVYFEELGWHQGVFWISQQCWLDRAGQ
jgi:hypothetical protein